MQNVNEKQTCSENDLYKDKRPTGLHGHLSTIALRLSESHFKLHFEV